MAEFNILDHFDKLTPDEGSAPKGSRSFYCPVCNPKNFKVELKSGKYNTFTCDCAPRTSTSSALSTACCRARRPQGRSAPLQRSGSAS